MNSNIKVKVKNIFKRKPNNPFSVNQLLKELNIPKQNRNSLKRVMRNLVSSGELKKLKGGRYIIHRTNNNKGINKRKIVSIENDDKELENNFIAKVIKKGKSFFLVPRAESLPTMQLEDGTNPKLINDGNVVSARVISLNKSKNYKIAKILRDHGKSGDINSEKKALTQENKLRDSFPRKVNDELKLIPKVNLKTEINKRVDLQNEIIFTIDGEDAKDFDDAVGIRKIRNGYKLWVSVADVSHYVRHNKALDKEAYERATSTYLPQKVIPMLPEKLSNDLCSLVPNEARFTKTAEINFDKSGNVKGYKIYKSIIQSYSRLTYTKVSSILENHSNHQKVDEKIVSRLKLMFELYKKIKKIRIQSGELDFDFPETELIRNSEGKVINIEKTERNVAHGIIEEFMIAANSVVAEFIFKKKVPSIYRIHEQPDEESILELMDQLNEIGVNIRLNPKVKPKEIQRLMNQVRNRNDKDFIYHSILRSLKKAVYSTNHIPHFGLSLEDYTHFTSPIRRYPDLIVHRILDHLLSKKKSPYELDELDNIAEHCSAREREAEKVEREFVNLECVNFMKERLGEDFDAKVISIHPFGIFVELKDYFVEGFIPKATYRGRGKKRKWFQIADKIRVKLVEADMEKRRLTFNLAN